jgi:HSP20 family protein
MKKESARKQDIERRSRKGSISKEEKQSEDPRPYLESLKITMSELFAELFMRNLSLAGELPLQPMVDMHREKSRLVVEVLIPGVNRETLMLRATPNLLTLSGTMRIKEKPGESFLREIPRGPFSRSIPLPCEVDPEKIFAELKEGILEIKLPLKGKGKARSVDITVE